MNPASRALVAGLVILFLGLPAAAHAEIHPTNPPPGATIAVRSPAIIASFGPGVDLATVHMIVDRKDVTEDVPENVRVTDHNVTYTVPAIRGLDLRDGLHNVTVRIGSEEVRWNFTVDLTIPQGPSAGANLLFLIVATVGGIAAVAGTGAIGAYAYLRKRKGYTMEKLLVRFPIKREHLVLGLPAFIATLVVLAGFAYADSHPFHYSTEYTLVVGLVFALAPYGIDSRRAKRRRRLQEKAFTQFLYELSDAMRGGIDPYKAIQELAKTDKSVLQKGLAAASDSIRLGRPLETVMRNLGRSSKSALLERYATLVGEASTAGGEVAGVVYRAAKDLDELVRIERERAAKMTAPVVTMYISFGVLMMIVASMLSFAPQLAAFGAPQKGAGDAGATGGVGSLLSFGDAPKLDVATMQLHFFHLLLANALGAGLLIGSFVSGKVRDGLLHALLLLGVAAVAFPIIGH